MKLKFLLLIAGFLILATTVNAQISNDIIVSVVPPNPAPNEETTITLKSFVYNLDTVLITWFQNGKTATSGIGKKSFSVTAPNTGETTITAKVSLPGGGVEVAATIKPSVMVLLWEATDSYVPPFYRGKALPSADSEVKVVAMPEIKSGVGYVPAGNMTYYWKKNYTNEVDGSGYGKNFFIYTDDYLEDASNISVTAATIDQKSSVDANIYIGTVPPKILFYKNDSISGTRWDEALPENHKINGHEIVEAIPYFISPKEIGHPSLIWSWFINDDKINLTNLRKNLMPLVAQEGVSGTSRLRLNIENREKIFQTTNKEINIEF